MKQPGESMDDIVKRLITAYQQVISVEEDIPSKEREDLDTLLDEFCEVSTDELQRVIEASRKSFSLIGDSYEKGST